MTSRSVLGRVLVGLVTAACLVPTVVLLRTDGWTIAPIALAQGCLIAAGLLLWSGPTWREGVAALTAAALLGLGVMDSPPFADLGGYWMEVGWIAYWAATPPVAYVVLAHPQGRLSLVRHRWLLLVTGLWAYLLPLVRAGAWDPAFAGYSGPARWGSWWPSQALDRGLFRFQVVLCVGIVAWFVVECVLRWRRAQGLARIPVRWSAGAGIALAVGVVVRQVGNSGVLDAVVPEAGLSALGWLLPLSLAVAVALLVAIGIRSAVRRNDVTESVLRAAGDPRVVEAALREQLADPELRVAFAVDGQWVGSDGRPVEPRSASADRTDHVLLSDPQGLPLVTVDVATSASADPGLLRAALDTAALALDNGRLAIEREVHLAEISASRARIVESGLTQRRQLERDLHDGAQQHLLAVSASLSRAERVDRPDDKAAAIDDAKAALRVALDELRSLARGVHPAALSQHGLGGALDSLATSVGAVDVHLSGDLAAGARLGATTEATVYFVVAEAVTNARKHAPTSRVCVRLDRVDGAVRVLVSDAGPGGAKLDPGGGLAGIRDRVRAVGGELQVSSSQDGSVVEAHVPETSP
ncbi:MAG TPA: histidine kinase [Lapillicoccus sp.]|nr:histidine kinase [Lapillicoccus sp.]